MIYFNNLFKLFSKKQVVVNEPVAEANTISVIRNRYRESIGEKLKAENLCFIECDTRANYGMIGWIYQNGEKAIQLFGTTFYVHNPNIPINIKNIELIRAIQAEFKEVSRDEKNSPSVNPQGFGAKL